MTGQRVFGIATMSCAVVFGTVSARAQSSSFDRGVAQAVTRAAQGAAPAATPSAVTPGPVVKLSLDEAVRFALDKNLDIAVQRLNPELQDIQIASADAAYRPTLTSTVSKASQDNAPTSQLQVGSSTGGGVTNDTLTYNVGFAQSVPWHGGSVSAIFNNSRVATTSNNAFYNPQFASVWTASYLQPLLRSFEMDTSRRQLLVSRINRDISDVQLRATLTNVVSNVRNAYWDYVFTSEAVDVQKQSLELAEKLVQDNQVRVEVGAMAPIDVVQAQAEAATRRQALVVAQSAKRTAELALKRMIVSGTEDPNWSASLDPVDRPEFLPEPIDIDEAVRRAIADRTDIAIARKNVEANDVTVKYLHSSALPQVDLQVNYGVQGVGGPYLQRSNTGVLGSQITQTVPGGLVDAFRTLFKANYPRWTVGVNFAYPIGQSSQDAAVARARVQLNQVKAQINLIELQVATEVSTAGIQVQNAVEAVEAAQASRELSQQRLEAEQSKFEVGMSTNYFVVQAQRDLADARNSELRNILNYRKALVEFERLQQTTLQNSNITVVSASTGTGGAQTTTP